MYQKTYKDWERRREKLIQFQIKSQNGKESEARGRERYCNLIALLAIETQTYK